MCGLLFVFQTTCINGCKSKLLFKPPATVKPAVTRSLPRGGGLGRGHSPNFGNLSQHLNLPNTSLAACCSLSNSLPRERGRGGCWDEGFCKENRLCRLLFTFQTTFINAQFRQPAPYNFQKPNQNQPSATVQAAFPILATRAGFPPVRRLSAAKFRGSKNAAR